MKSARASGDKKREKGERKASEVTARHDAGTDEDEPDESESRVQTADPSDAEQGSDELPAADLPENSDPMRPEKEPEKGDAMRASDEPEKGDSRRAADEPRKEDAMRAADDPKPTMEDASRASDEPKQGDEMPGSDTSVERDGGSDAPLSDASKEELTYYKDTKPIIDAKCAICHMPGGIAPMAFTSYAQVKPFTTLMRLDIEAGVMPPWLPSDPPGKFIGDRRLTAEQKDTLLRWFAAGAPEGNPVDEPAPLPQEGRRSLAQVDQSLPMAQAYEPVLSPDEYRCFVLEWPHEVTKYITALEIVPGNRQLVHHAIVYYVTPDRVQAVRDREAEDPEPGYPCFGGVGNAAWLTSYEPGGHADEIPGQVGFAIEPGAVMVLQIHYNTLHGTGSDLTHVDLTLKDQVERVGNVQLIMDPRWPSGSMQIPMGEPDVVHSYTGRGANLSTMQNYEILWVDMHMHALGSAGRIGIVRANGDLEELVNIPAWDFGWQETFMFREPVTLFPDDNLYVECHFDNTPDNQIIVDGVRLPPRDVNWGDHTTDEMCLGNVLIAPSLSPPTMVAADAI